MDEDIIAKSISLQENQILSIRREMKGVHASITDLEKRMRISRLTLYGVSIILIVFGIWTWFL